MHNEEPMTLYVHKLIAPAAAAIVAVVVVVVVVSAAAHLQ